MLYKNNLIIYLLVYQPAAGVLVRIECLVQCCFHVYVKSKSFNSMWKMHQTAACRAIGITIRISLFNNLEAWSLAIMVWIEARTNNPYTHALLTTSITLGR